MSDRRGWKWLARLRFHAFQRHRYKRLVIERAAGQPFVVLPQVFNPGLFRSGAVLAATLGRPAPGGAGRALDMGTGSGIGAVTAARQGWQVVATDINEAAVRCARINALLNEVEGRVEVRHGDLFEPVAGERFDVVLFNPPFFRGVPADALAHAWRGVDVVERFAAGLREHLAPGGYALVVLSTDGEHAAFLHAFEAAALGVTVLQQCDLRYEMLTVYRLTEKGEPQGEP